jgi:hypothetical protein
MEDRQEEPYGTAGLVGDMQQRTLGRTYLKEFM